MPSAELEGVIPPVVSGLAGYWIGGVLGCWLGLRWRPYRNAGLTITYLAVLLLLGILLDFFMVPFIQALTLPIMTFQAIILPLLARFLTKPSVRHSPKED